MTVKKMTKVANMQNRINFTVTLSLNEPNTLLLTLSEMACVFNNAA